MKDLITHPAFHFSVELLNFDLISVTVANASEEQSQGGCDQASLLNRHHKASTSTTTEVPGPGFKLTPQRAEVGLETTPAQTSSHVWMRGRREEEEERFRRC